MSKLFSFFDLKGAKAALGEGVTKELIGNKALNLIEMLSRGYPVPEGFVLPTSLTFAMPSWGYAIDDDIIVRARGMIRFAADCTGREWGTESPNPYLVSVRSGAAVSMPGMMDTILNLGLNDHNVESLISVMGEDKRAFVLDCYRRLIQMYATTVHGSSAKPFNEVYEAAKEFYIKMDAEALTTVVSRYKEVFAEELGRQFPQDVDLQLTEAITAVYRSWFSERATVYREHAGIPHDLGTAVTIQGMRFGNLNDKSCTGVVFSRNPNTGVRELYGEFLPEAQGEDVVAGTHNARPIAEMSEWDLQLAAAIANYTNELDATLGDIADVEFTVEDGTLWILQARVGKRSVDADLYMVLDELLPEPQTERKLEVVKRMKEKMGQLKPRQQQKKEDTGLVIICQAKGQGVSGGVAVGRPCWTKEQAAEARAAEEPYIFVATETSPDDTPEMLGAAGILTATGSSVSHAAVCAREWGLPAVVGCGEVVVDPGGDDCWINGTSLKDAMVQLDGTTGEVMVKA